MPAARRPPARTTPAALAAIAAPLALAALAAIAAAPACSSGRATPADAPDADEALAAHCEAHVGEPRVEEVAPGLFVAVGWDLANTVLFHTDAGNVVVDVGMSPERAAPVRDALLAVAPGPTLAVIYTHSHLDHVGGASVWVEEGTQIWATDAFLLNLLSQYGLYRDAEEARATRQFGQNVSADLLPCSAIGRNADVDAARAPGLRAPTHTFTGRATLEVGGLSLELVEAHGETTDQLFVYSAAHEALLPGDNFYAAFPNLYTIRGTRPRPVDAWIASLDAMRARDPAVLVPSHTSPVVGREAVREALRDYRDAIQWLRDGVVRAANAGEALDTLVAAARLPEHLAASPWLAERYGQVDWSVRALYTNALGWFDGKPWRLYPPDGVAAREIALMGGADAVLAEAERALADGDARWSVHLVGRLVDAGLLAGPARDAALAAGLRAVAPDVLNTNGRAYLLESARELEEGPPDTPRPPVDAVFAQAVPTSFVLEVLTTRLLPGQEGVHESLRVVLTDVEETWTLTVRRGVVEVWEGDPLPGTPAPEATLTTDAVTWRNLALQVVSPLDAFASGALAADDLLAVLSFLDRFQQGL